MAEYDETTYGERIAEVYDLFYQNREDLGPVVDFLAPLAKGRRVLELGIGTGRIALPLAARGIKVHGIDASPAMVAKMREKPGGAEIPVTMGNFADVKIGGQFALIYIPFSTFFALPSQEDQVRCFARVAKRLTSDGAFVIDAFVPDHRLLAERRRVAVVEVNAERVVIDAAQFDPVVQKTRAQHIVIADNQPPRLYPVEIRFAYPAELDLMARLAGMRLRERWGGWDRRPFNSESMVHVSVYEPVPQPKVEPIEKARRPRLKMVPAGRRRRARG
jgi:SAM-dependent methyltransferase